MTQAELLRRLRKEGVVLSRQEARLLVRPSLDQLPEELADSVGRYAGQLLDGAPMEPLDRRILARASTIRGWSEARRELFSGLFEDLVTFGLGEADAVKQAFDWAKSLVQPLTDTPSTGPRLPDVVGSEEARSPAPEQSSGDANGNSGIAATDTPSAMFLASLGLQTNYITTAEDGLDAVAEILRGAVECEPFGLDIETMSQSGAPRITSDDTIGPRSAERALSPNVSSIRLVQIFSGGKVVYIFDLRDLEIEVLQPLWARSFVAHNASFEMKHLGAAGCAPERLECSYLAEHAVTGRARSLAELASMLTGWALSKESQTSDWSSPSLTNEQLAYAAVDAVAAWKCWRVLSGTKDFERVRELYELERAAVPAVAMMETAGIRVDRSAHRDLLVSLRSDRESAQEALQELVGADVNVRSAKQLSAALAKTLPEEWPRTKSGLLATDRQALLRGGDVPVCKALLSFRATDQLCKTFGANLLDTVDPISDRLHPSFNLAGTITGRLTASRPNVQQIPAKADRRFRSLFVPSAGSVFVVGDYSQIELRVAALLSGDSVMKAAYESGEDLHVLTAAAITGKAPNEVTADERTEAKAANFGPLYGQQAAGLREKLFADFGKDVSLVEAENYLAAFFDRYPELGRYLEDTASSAYSNGFSSTQMGRRRWYTNAEGTAYVSRQAPRRALSRGRSRPDPWRRSTAVNTPIQGSAAEVNLRALARIYAALEGTPAVPVLNVHDEFILECPEAFGGEAKVLLETEMLGAFLDVFPEGEAIAGKLVEAVVARSWGEAK